MAMADISKGIGLEIGPLDKPIVLKATSNVRYVDAWAPLRCWTSTVTIPMSTPPRS